MQNHKHKIHVAVMILVILAMLLSACGTADSTTPTPAAASTEIAVMIQTEEPTQTATPRPDAQAAAVTWANAMLTLDAKESPTLWTDRICALANEYGCQSIQAWNMASVYAKYPELKTQPVIKSTRLLYAGNMSDGSEYQVWEVLGERTNPPTEKLKSFNLYPTFVWSAEHARWEFFYSPDGPTAKSLSVCGQFIEYAADGHAYSTDAEWQAVYAQCQNATPLPPTPFVPVTPVFTPQP